MIINNLSIETEDNIIFDLALRYNVVSVDIFDKAAKDKLINRLRDKEGFIVIDKTSKGYLGNLDSTYNKFIVIDCDGLFLDLSVLDYISTDKENQYLLFRDNPTNFHHNSTRMSLLGNKYYLDYDFLNSPDIIERFEEKDKS